MPIAFSLSRWEQVRETYRRWWAGDLQRPAVSVELPRRTPSRPEPRAPLLSQATCAPSYMLQCDAAYMIGKEMFGRFVLPELTASCSTLDHPFYHLDGFGQLRHLDSILAIPNLRGVQWVPGDGQPGCDQWPEVYRMITELPRRMEIEAGEGFWE